MKKILLIAVTLFTVNSFSQEVFENEMRDPTLLTGNKGLEKMERKTKEPCTVKARDSINTLVDSLRAESARLLISTNKENPVIKNIDKAYLELLQKREELQTCLDKKLKTKNKK
jgi:hypothetical protein